MTINWNVEKPGLVDGPEEEYFEFQITSNRESGFNASVIDATACARCLLLLIANLVRIYKILISTRQLVINFKIIILTRFHFARQADHKLRL